MRDSRAQVAASATRSATFELNCPVLHQLGLRAALESLGQRMRRLFGLRVHVSGDPEAAGLGPEVQQVVFRVVRELVNNVYKHAEVTEAWVETQRAGDWVNFSVRDEGRGFDDSAELPRFGPDGGFGLLSARAQVRAIGGWLQVDTALGRGVRAIVKVPSAPPEPSAHLPGGCRGWQ